MIKSNRYTSELKTYVLDNEVLFRNFDRRSILISGAAGLIGSNLIDLLIFACMELGVKIKVFACDRNYELLMARFPVEFSNVVDCHAIDICSDCLPDVYPDYLIHAASNTSPVDYALKPLDTIWTNICGTKKLCDFSVQRNVRRFLFCSSVEAYGKNNGDVDAFSEDYSGYVNCNTLRANYPSAKRCAEAMLNAYAAENSDFDFVTARIGRFYGPTVIAGDAKAPSQFIHNAVTGENVIMKSDGSQLYSWGYVCDCATALLTLLVKGESGNVYNVADPNSCRTLKEFAMIVAQAGNTNLEFSEQSITEKNGYSKITKATLDVRKLCSLGWTAKHGLETGIPQTVEVLKSL